MATRSLRMQYAKVWCFRYASTILRWLIEPPAIAEEKQRRRLRLLAAVVLPNVTGLAGEGQTEAAKAELVTVQTAMDTMMAKNSLTSVTATSATANMSAFPTGNALYPDYLRTATTKGTYSCSTTGLVTQVTKGY